VNTFTPAEPQANTPVEGPGYGPWWSARLVSAVERRGQRASGLGGARFGNSLGYGAMLRSTVRTIHHGYAPCSTQRRARRGERVPLSPSSCGIRRRSVRPRTTSIGWRALVEMTTTTRAGPASPVGVRFSACGSPALASGHPAVASTGPVDRGPRVSSATALKGRSVPYETFEFRAELSICAGQPARVIPFDIRSCRLDVGVPAPHWPHTARSARPKSRRLVAGSDGYSLDNQDRPEGRVPARRGLPLIGHGQCPASPWLRVWRRWLWLAVPPAGRLPGQLLPPPRPSRHTRQQPWVMRRCLRCPRSRAHQRGLRGLMPQNC
jgi:hypothetical protein